MKRLLPSLMSITQMDGWSIMWKIYPDIFKLSNKSYQWLCERAIISPITAGEINDIILLKFDGHSREYLSIDTVTSTDDAIHYPQEFHVIPRKINFESCVQYYIKQQYYKHRDEG
ncbi:ATP-dependent DNA helicase [Aphis craccivora]|uniref:ATP-dependent DNA helicase n=1 Tax=Aphis craccivora TaxID=307492 RepID=A0A6G0VNS4_APHCR|nr:ATP-dependent DNA helicase [Aphis craccivora]